METFGVAAGQLQEAMSAFPRGNIAFFLFWGQSVMMLVVGCGISQGAATGRSILSLWSDPISKSSARSNILTAKGRHGEVCI